MRRRSSLSFGPLALASVAFVVLLPMSAAQAQGRVIGVISDQRMPDSAQQVAALAASIRMRSPAAMALTAKEELGLSPEQVAAIEALVPIEADSIRVRTARMMESMRGGAAKYPGMANGMSWTGPIDEAAIRAGACEQSRGQADILIGMMRDRHALGILLTPDQQRQFDRLQGEMMMRALRAQVK